jgi:glyoxylase-like metal-dependent hydrolase (beta-lactamase superfamily II)
MILQQYVLGCLSHASYLIADESSGVAAVVDPQRDVDQYLADAERHRCTIRHVLLTHFHADFVSGHLELAARAGARIHLGAAGRSDYPAEPMADGGTLDLGPGVRLTFLATPGHTPESTCIAVWDRAKSPHAPHAVLTGDTLFCGDVGRPDLMASAGCSADDLARQLYASLQRKLMALPDATRLYPAHTAGSMCGKNLSPDTVSTIGTQRRGNYALQARDEDEFVRLVTADQPDCPAYFAFDADLNRRRRATLEEALAKSLVALPLERVL